MRSCMESSQAKINGEGFGSPLFIMKALKTVKTQHGFFKRGKEYKLSQKALYDLTEGRIKQGKQPLFRETKEHKPAYEIEQKGSWFTVYLNGEQVDKFQGKDGLKKWV